MNLTLEFLSKIVVILVLGVYGGFCTTFSSSAPVVSTTPISSVPVYRFHYIVKDEKTGSYKAQKEQQTGDNVIGSYMVAGRNSDPRIMNYEYVADVANGFKADVNVNQGGSPLKTNAGNQLSTANPPRDGITPFNNYRTGISAPSLNRKPTRGYSPIVVGTQPFVTIPFPAVKETGNPSAIPIATKKSVQVDLTYNEKSIEKMGKKLETDTSTTTVMSLINSGNEGMNNMDIPSTVMEIMNQNKAKSASEKLTVFDTIIATAERNDLIQNGTESTPIATTTTALSPSPFKKVVVPQRPMRLIGLSPIYMEMAQLQSITENLTTVPQLHLEPFTNIQYATPSPFVSGPLPGGPVGPFRNLPRSVPETVNVPPEYPFVNSIPIFSSIPISAPIIAPPMPPPMPTSDIKSDVKSDNKTPPSSLPICQDCIFPAGFAATLPIVKMPAAAPASSSVPANTGSQQLQKMQCPPSAPVQWGPYTPNLMYVLMPMPLLKNKINETRPATTSIWRK